MIFTEKHFTEYRMQKLTSSFDKRLKKLFSIEEKLIKIGFSPVENNKKRNSFIHKSFIFYDIIHKAKNQKVHTSKSPLIYAELDLEKLSISFNENHFIKNNQEIIVYFSCKYSMKTIDLKLKKIQELIFIFYRHRLFRLLNISGNNYNPINLEIYKNVKSFFKNNYKKTIYWFITSNPFLGDLKPIDLIYNNKSERLLQLVLSLIEENN